MHALSVVGPGAEGVVAALADDLSEDGRVAVVERGEVSERGSDTPDADYTLDGEGNWTGVGRGRSFPDLLDDLAPDYDYALIAGFSTLRLPTVAVDTPEDEVAGNVVRAVEDAADLDIADLADALPTFDPYVTLDSLVEAAKASPDAQFSGAIATFTGTVRGKESPDDDRTTHLAFEKYEGVAEQRLAAISDELTDREGVHEVLMHHRTGVIPDGEDIVFVVVLAGHREEAFRTVEDGIDRLKDEVPIFKKETTTAEEFWVHQRE